MISTVLYGIVSYKLIIQINQATANDGSSENWLECIKID